MHRIRFCQPSAILTTLFAVLLATSAQAQFWEVVYDLGPDGMGSLGSILTTTAPNGPFTDPVTGTLTMHYDATSTGAPLTGARLVAGQIDGTISQNAGVLLVTGSNMNTLTPGTAGTPGTLSGNTLNLSVVANHTLTGFLHCYDATGGAGGNCGLFFGTPASNTIPQNATGTFSFPNFNFTSATAGVGDFTSDAITSMPQPLVTTSLVYRGREISRTFMPEASGFAMLLAGGLLVAGLRGRR